MTPLVRWVLAVMTALQPSAPWKDDYQNVAEGIIEGAKENPVFSGESGVLRTIALDISVSWFESRFNRHAIGDKGAAHGLFQVHAAEDSTVKEQTIRANRMILASFKICKDRPLIERLGWYTAGGQGCRGTLTSKHRMNLALRLLRERPYDEGNDSGATADRM